ncbi:hypothetical protein HaLaN_21519 [Haematococcus lacustris]|uniref:Uncharacterized protein n=1 Tax=Haematococcus lacustris TaxID=44745 RepID=A0A699ZPH5_HAELA|nr:hypothetical protein HaLaN_21519 [Haematococcus lacustris]
MEADEGWGLLPPYPPAGAGSLRSSRIEQLMSRPVILAGETCSPGLSGASPAAGAKHGKADKPTKSANVADGVPSEGPASQSQRGTAPLDGQVEGKPAHVITNGGSSKRSKNKFKSDALQSALQREHTIPRHETLPAASSSPCHSPTLPPGQPAASVGKTPTAAPAAQTVLTAVSGKKRRPSGCGNTGSAGMWGRSGVTGGQEGKTK